VADTFISYRRDDTAGYAGRLHEALEQRLGRGRVFRDVDTLRPGEDFVRAIADRLRHSRVFVALIGREWSQARDPSGRRRLDLEDDYVRLEIAAALDRDDLLIVPVLVEGASMPPAADLPPAIARLAHRHAIALRDDTWESDVDRLAGLIRPPRLHRLPLTWPVAAAIALAVIVIAGFLARSDDGTAQPETAAADAAAPAVAAASSFPAYALRVPPVAEVAHGTLLYTLLSGSVAPHGAANELRLRVRVSNEGRYDANLWDASFRLDAAGRTLSPTSGLNRLLAGHSIDEAIVTFDVPPGTGAATLRVLGGGDAAGELPLDLRPTGRPAENEDAPAGDALSKAILFPVQRDPVPLLADDGAAVTLRGISGRRFANLVRLRVAVDMENRGRYPGWTGALTMRVAVEDRVLPPFEAPNAVVDPAARYSGTYVFDVPPAARRVILRAAMGDQTAERPLDVPPAR
jgi:hypothetical protein